MVTVFLLERCVIYIRSFLLQYFCMSSRSRSVGVNSALSEQEMFLHGCPSVCCINKRVYWSGVQLGILAMWPWWLDEGREDYPAFSCVFPLFLICSSNQIEEDEALWCLKFHLSVGLAPWLASLHVGWTHVKLKGSSRNAGGWKKAAANRNTLLLG